MKVLEKIAKVEPHIAYSAYVKGFQHKFTYLIRTIPDILIHLQRLDKAIDQYVLKPIMNYYEFSDLERIWFSLPPRLGGLGINIISEIAPIYHTNSKKLTKPLVEKIIFQNDISMTTGEDQSYITRTKAEMRTEKAKWEEEKMGYIKGRLDMQKLKLFESITEKSASSWLTALPLKEHDFYLNKSLFWDTIYICDMVYPFPGCRPTVYAMQYFL